MSMDDYRYNVIDGNSSYLARYYALILNRYNVLMNPDDTYTQLEWMYDRGMKIFYLYRMYQNLMEEMKKEEKPHINRDVTDKILDSIISHPAVIDENDELEDREPVQIVNSMMTISLMSRTAEEQDGQMEDLEIEKPVATFWTTRPDPVIHGKHPLIITDNGELQGYSAHPNVNDGNGGICIGGDFALHSAIEYRDIPLILTCLDDFLSQYNADDCYWNPDNIREDINREVNPCNDCYRMFACSLCCCDNCDAHGTEECADCMDFQMPNIGLCEGEVDDLIDLAVKGETYQETVDNLCDVYNDFDDIGRVVEHFRVDFRDDEIDDEEKPEIEDIVQYMKDDLRDYLHEDAVVVAENITRNY